MISFDTQDPAPARIFFSKVGSIFALSILICNTVKEGCGRHAGADGADGQDAEDDGQRGTAGQSYSRGIFHLSLSTCLSLRLSVCLVCVAVLSLE